MSFFIYLTYHLSFTFNIGLHLIGGKFSMDMAKKHSPVRINGK